MTDGRGPPGLLEVPILTEPDPTWAGLTVSRVGDLIGLLSVKFGPFITHLCRCVMAGYLDDRVEQDDARLLGDDLLGGEVMLDELRDGGEARPFKPVLTLPERERERGAGGGFSDL